MSFVSCIAAIRMFLVWRREAISECEFWIPLQLNCRMLLMEIGVGGVLREGVLGFGGD